MALLFMDGFDHSAYGENAYKWDWGASNGYSAGGRTGYYANNSYCAKYLVPSGSTAIVGFATTLGMTACISHSSGGQGDQYQAYVSLDAAGIITARRGDGTILGSSAPNAWRSSAWNYIEFKVLIDNSVGTFTVKCNGATVITLTGQDTQNQSDATWNWVRFNFPGGTLDDVYMCDASGAQNNDFLGEVRVVTLLPQTDAVGGAGANADFTCSTSTDHGALVDEQAPNSDTDYVYSSTPNHVDTWNYPALGYTGTIKGVQMCLFAKKTDSGTRAIAAVARPVSTNRVHGTDHYLTTSYTYWRALWELNPEDSAAWEVADVDGSQFGVKITV